MILTKWLYPIPLALVLSLTLPQPAFAQSDDPGVENTEPSELAAAAEVEEPEAATEVEEIIVTGSRIRRDAYSSASPIQIIDGSRSRELGLIDTAALLQSATQATGQQIDSTFTAFVLDNGPGASQVNLRGLGTGRSLLLLNSKRLASGGVGGAPTSPDLSTIPSIVVDRIELLLDGASSIYGSDAISGVINVLTRRDFEGFEFEADVVEPYASGGSERTLGLMWGGGGGDRWNIGVAIEYYDRETIQLKDRSFTKDCERYLYVDQHGKELTEDLLWVPGTTINSCTYYSINDAFLGVGFGSIFATPGETNIGIPNFSASQVGADLVGFNPAIFPIDIDRDGEIDTGLVDTDGDGEADVDENSDFINANGSARERTGDLVSGSERLNIYAYGDYDLASESNTSLYFEFLYAKRDTKVFLPVSQLFPDVPGDNPYNPCNQDAPGGVNCLDFFGIDGAVFGNLEIQPTVAVRGDRENNDVTLEQFRFVTGATGDLLAWRNTKGFDNWSYDVNISYSKSVGKDKSFGILEPELLHSLETSAIDPVTGEIVCGDDDNEDGVPDGVDCVPINLFAPSLHQSGGGTFATQAEHDYLFGTRSFNTQIEQTIVGGVLQGDAFELPWNNTKVPLVFGIEYRKDAIDSRPNDVAGEGLFYGFFKDGGAKGSRTLSEVFIESEFQLLQDLPFAREWSLNLAVRWTDESTYGDHTTYSVKTRYVPVEGITLRGTYGTSFRAPNAHEQFLIGQSGFTDVFDPCVVPNSARDAGLGIDDPVTYNPTLDRRTQTILDNCRVAGVDPTMLGLTEDSVYQVEILEKGGEQIQFSVKPETSTSFTYGFILDQPFSDNYTLRFSATYFEVEIEDSISSLSSGFVVNDCYVVRADATSDFCSLITRDEDGYLDQIDTSFININAITSRGLDLNLYGETDFIIADRNLNLGLDIQATKLLENKFIFRDFTEDDAKTPIAPKWEGSVQLTAGYSDFRFNWRASYISGERDTFEEFARFFPCPRAGTPRCRPIAETDDYWVHTAAITWESLGWAATIGVVNVFDKEPPLLDDDAPETQLNNIPLGAGYDIFGRRLFTSVRKAF